MLQFLGIQNSAEQQSRKDSLMHFSCALPPRLSLVMLLTLLITPCGSRGCKWVSVLSDKIYEAPKPE